MELVTGRKGVAHITSQQDRMKHQGMFGEGAYILKTGQMLEPQVQTSNEIRIRDGALMVQGALSCVKTNSYDAVTIQNGTQGMKRIDLICWQYTYDAEQDVESAEWVVIQGTPAASDPQQPSYTDGDIQQGDSPVQVPIFAVELDGINVTGVTTLVSTAPSLEELNGKMTGDDDWSTYSNNGWEMQYRHISQNQVYVEVQKTSTGNNAAIVGDLVMAGVPFTASFNQNVPVYMSVAGSIVGYGRANFPTNNGLYLYTPAYGNSVTYTVFGIVTVE